MAITSTASPFPQRQYKDTFTTSGTWTCPSGTNSVDVVIVGGGGGGGSAYASANANYAAAAGGGGGGQVVRKTLTVTPGTTYSVVIGAGGSGNTANPTQVNYSRITGSGGNGGFSSFGLTSTLANGNPYHAENAIYEYPASVNYYANSGWNAYYLYLPPGGWFWKSGSGSYASPTTYTTANSSSIYANNSYYLYSVGTTNWDTNLPSTTFSNYFGGIGDGSWCNWIPVTGSTAYTASGLFYHGASSGFSAGIHIEWYTAFEGTFISRSNSTAINAPTGANQWTSTSVTATAPSNATYALVRYLGYYNSAGIYMHWAKMQFEQGSSVTNYKGIFHTENGGTFDGTKVVNVTSGALAAGGGGGASMYNNAASSTFYWTVPGFGGGGAVFTQSGSANHCHGGHGAGQTPGSSMILQGYAGSTNSAVPVMFQYGLPCPWGRGGNGLYITTSSTATIPGDGGIAPGASPEGYGAGGGGGIALSSSANIYMSPPQVGPGAGFSGFNNGTFTTVKGGHGTPNTGAGGGGGASYAGATVAPGGNGGSGIITISYWGY